MDFSDIKKLFVWLSLALSSLGLFEFELRFCVLGVLGFGFGFDLMLIVVVFKTMMRRRC